MQMQGWLVVNAFTHTEKFTQLFARLEICAAHLGIGLCRKTNTELLPCLYKKMPQAEKPDFVLFWDKDVKLCRLLEQQGIRTFNSARAIALCDDKALTYLALAEKGIPQPKTILVPKVFHPVDWSTCDFAADTAAALGLPFVIKECFGSFGAEVHLAHTVAEANDILNSIGTRPALCQAFIAASAGHDVRIEVVGGRAVAAMYRYTENGDFRANVTAGASMRAYTPTAAEAALAVRAAAALGTDFAGVDVLQGENGPILCEVNSNAHFINLDACTGACAEEAILRYIMAETAAGHFTAESGAVR